VVSDRNYVGKRFAGPGPGAEYVVFLRVSKPNGFFLVQVQIQRITGAVRLLFVPSENPSALRVKLPLCDQIIDFLSWSEVRVDLDQWIAP
jgi:hypothetical protein